MHNINIGEKKLTITETWQLVTEPSQITLSPETRKVIQSSRLFLDEKMKRVSEPVYGINTGFGSLCNTVINDKDLSLLQENLVKSHACGSGSEVPPAIVKLMLLLKVQGLSQGFSSVQVQTVQRLADMFNQDILPVIYAQGSLGASGDLAPMAHLCLPLLGLGEVYMKGQKVSGAEMNRQMGWKPLTLQSKEGLALLNGTQFMSSFGCYCISMAGQLLDWADLVAAASLDAFDGRYEPFNALLHQIRPHQGQITTAANIRRITRGSEIGKRGKAHVQDPYSFRCVPQVHGASRDAAAWAAQVVETEINAVTDNPTVFSKEDLVLSGGNFHGQPLALALDLLAMAVAELGSISERRTYQLISGQRNLPAFLVAEPGLNSGFMIPQYTAAALVSQSKQWCTPASVDSIVSSNGQEDHVSMGANAATKCYQVIQNTWTILGIELMNAMQGLDFRKPERSGAIVEKLYADFRKVVPFVQEDKIMYTEMDKARTFLLQHPPHTYLGHDQN